MSGDETRETLPPPTLPPDAEGTFAVRSDEATMDRPGAPPGELTLARWGGDTAAPTAATPPPPTPFQLVRPIAQGGMGEVWEAVQTALGRTVAVKRIRSSRLAEAALDERERRELILTFQQEAFISARLEHPNIVPIHDQGLDGEGLPMLAMKRVVGEPWGDILRRERKSLPPAEFVARHVTILIQVAQAVAFAHSRGVVHRDLKPSQVMVGEFGEVLLMDWGLAIDLGDAPADRPAQPPYPVAMPDREWASNPSGTPAYMAPEQTEATAARVGRWTDVYLLGGILFSILTGTNPHPGGSSEACFRHASERPVEDPRERAPRAYIPAELADLCNECLRRDPARRVASAAALTTRLQDYLTGAGKRRRSVELTEEVGAAVKSLAPSYEAFASHLSRLEQAAGLWAENPDLAPLRENLRSEYARFALASGDLALARVRARLLDPGREREKLLREIDVREAAQRGQRRRLRLAVASTLTLLGVLLASSVIVSARFRAQRDAEAGLRAEAEKAQRSAHARAAESNSVIDFLMEDVSKSLDPQLPRDQELIARVADRATRHFRDLDLSDASPTTKGEVAAASDRVARSLSALGRDGDALELAQRSLALWAEATGPDSLEVARTTVDAAQFHRRIGQVSEAEELIHGAIAAFARHADRLTWRERWGLEQAHGGILREKGQWEEAERRYRAALDTLERAGDPETTRYRANTLNDLATMFTFSGRRDEALPLLEAAVEAFSQADGPHAATTAQARLDLGHLFATRGRLDEALALYTRVEEDFRLEYPPDHPRYTTLYQRLGELHYALGENETALASYVRAVDIAEKVYGDDYYYLAPMLQGIAVIQMRLGNWDDARERLEWALRLQLARHGENSPYLVEIVLSIGFVHHHDGNVAEAETYYRRALALTEQHYAPGHPNNGFCKLNLGDLLAQQGRFDEAFPLLEQGLENMIAALGNEHPHIAAAHGIVIAGRVFRARGLEGSEATAGWEDVVERVDALPRPIAARSMAARAEALVRLGRRPEITEPLDPSARAEILDRATLEFLESEGLLAPAE